MAAPRADLLGSLQAARRVLVVVAHPDDESFGLGGILGTVVDAGVPVDVLCLTRGEASTLGRHDGGDLGAVRAAELAAAGQVVGVERTHLLGWPDGGLADRPLEELAEAVAAVVEETDPGALLVFDDSGVTGHPDHVRATEAARSVARQRGLTVLAWALPDDVATRLNGEFGTSFAGRPRADLEAVPVDRDRQRRAIACHASQSTDNPVLWRRLELSGDTDHLRRLA